MGSDIDSILSAMLADWHRYCQHTGERAGYPGRAAGLGQARSNSQYDWENGLESDAVDRRIMEGFDACVMRIPQPWLTALQLEARNLVARHAVWASPRLPADPIERAALIAEARRRLLRELAADGVLC